MTTTVRRPAGSLSNPVAGWSSAARSAMAACLILSGLLWVVAELIGFGLSDDARLRFLSEQPVLAGIAVTCDFLAVPFLAGAVVGWYLMSRDRSPKLALAGAIAFVFALTGQSIVNGVEASMYQMMNSGAISASLLSKALGSGPGLSIPGVTLMIIFNGGALAGIILLMIAVWRSHALPRTAAALLIVFQLLSLLPLPFPLTIVAAVALVWMAVSVLAAGRSVSATERSA